ncbi:MAG: DUF3795 domain-containing protein [Anaerolineae bacterium]|nr:DUF3795 domain-containing protein [Anaerolineae bacterium]
MSETDGFIFDGYCGLYCGACPAFLATRRGETIDGKQCKGCKSTVLMGWCAQCPLKACAQEKGYDSCAECDSFPCAPMTAFIEDQEYPYHGLVPGDIETIRAIGIPAWLAEQAERWRCPACGTPFAWRMTTCPACGGAVRSWAD